jgi:hypothetical protein
VGLNARRSIPFLLVLSAAAGCEGQRTVIAPDPVPVSVRVEGQIIDGENGEPVSVAVATVTEVCTPGGCGPARVSAASAVTDDQGVFRLTTSIPPAWRRLIFKLTRAGYETNVVGVSPDGTTAAVLGLLRTVTIRPGESIETRVLTGFSYCGSESWPCRRIMVESPAGATLDLEVIPIDHLVDIGLVAGERDEEPFPASLRRRVTMAGGQLWIYGGVGRVTLTARSR